MQHDEAKGSLEPYVENIVQYHMLYERDIHISCYIATCATYHSSTRMALPPFLAFGELCVLCVFGPFEYKVICFLFKHFVPGPLFFAVTRQLQSPSTGGKQLSSSVPMTVG